MKKRICILALMSIASITIAMDSDLSPSLQVFRRIGELRTSISKLTPDQIAALEKLKKCPENIEAALQKVSSLLEQHGHAQAQEEQAKAQTEFIKAEQELARAYQLYAEYEKILCCINNQSDQPTHAQNAKKRCPKTSSYIQSKL